jgi:hypothetical protein
LIVPKSLIGQWQNELANLFGIEAHDDHTNFFEPGVYLVGREFAGGERGRFSSVKLPLVPTTTGRPSRILGNNRKSIAIPTVRLLLHSLTTVRLLLGLARQPTNAAPVGCTRCHIGQTRLFALFTLRGTFRAGPSLLDSS